MRIFVGSGLLLAVAITGAGCNDTSASSGRPIERMWERPVISEPIPAAPVASTAPASGPAGAPGGVAVRDPHEILAYINGEAITRAQAGDELIRTHGLSLLQQMTLLIAARQRAAKMGLTVTQADVRAAHDEALRRISQPIGAPEEVSPDGRPTENPPLDREAGERLLTGFLVAKNISRAEWERRMEQQAYLRAIATAEVEQTEITEAMLREEYALQYGERVQVRHIQVSNLEAERRARELLAQRKDFELVARQLSENPVTASRGGLIPPFTRNDPAITPLLREAAFKLAVGEISPTIHDQNWYHILRLERRFPASDVGFEHVDRASLERGLKERLITQRMSELEAELFNSARVDIRDRALSEQFTRSREALR